MAEQSYSQESMYFLDCIKQEPGMDTSSPQSGMPIPTSRRISRNNGMNAEFGFDLEEALSLGAINAMPMGMNQSDPYNQGPSVWVSLCDTFKMDEDDDILQVDKADLIQGPTLAELNANDETLLEDLSFDDLLLPEEGVALYPGQEGLNMQNSSSSFPPSNQGFLRETQLSSSVPVSQGLFVGIPSPPGLAAQLHSPRSPRPGSSNSNVGGTSRHSTLHELLMRRNEPEAGNSQLSPGSFTLLAQAGVPTSVSRLSSSAPTHLGLEQIWQRREPRQHLLSTGSLVEAGSTSSLSTGGILSPASHELSHDEGFDSEDDSDHYDDFSSDGDSSDGEGGGRARSGSGSKKERYFWQYNVQAKGPKGQRLVLKTKLEDPHVLNEVTDPVFSPNCAVRGIKHSGKARKGDGNDLTPNPRKLHSIGRELDKLGRVINDMTPVSELPLNVRPKSRKEKNKLASRACRLKKKAQHEANKIKLYGLEHEHKRLISTIAQIKNILATSYSLESKEAREEHARTVEKLRRLALKSVLLPKSKTGFDIAGNTTDFVNKILEKVKAGNPTGGIMEILN